MAERYALVVDALQKTYGSKRAVDALSFAVEPGAIFGLLGPNGAGKTTTLECAEGLKIPDGGSVSVFGINPLKHQGALWQTIGVQLQSSALPATMTAREALRFFSCYHHVEPDEGLLHRMGLTEHIDRKYGTYSTGMKRRLSLALAVAHHPKLVFFDEPTAGLDVQSRVELHAIMRELRSDGTTLVVATHDMAEAQSLCDTIGIVVHGRMVALGTPNQITASSDARTRITISTEQQVLVRSTPVVAGLDMLWQRDGYVCFHTEDPGPAVVALLEQVRRAGDVLVDLRVERPTLEERFMEIVRQYEEAV